MGSDPLKVANPLSEDLSVMRPLVLPGLLDAARHNAAHGSAEVALFESAHVYRASGPVEGEPLGAGTPVAQASPAGRLPVDERHHLAALLTRGAPAGWRSPGRPADYYAARGLLDALMSAVRVEWAPAGQAEPFLHPGRAARVACGDREIGWVGELHPQVAAAWDLDTGAAAFEIDFDALAELAPGPAYYSDVTSYPAALQDIAVVLPDDVTAAQAEEAVRRGGGELLASTRVFDVYRGEQVGEGSWSLALRLEFRAPDRTLTDDEVAELRAAIERELGEIGGRLRA